MFGDLAGGPIRLSRGTGIHQGRLTAQKLALTMSTN